MRLLFAKIILKIPIVPLYWLRLTCIEKKGNTFLNGYKKTGIYEKY